MNERKVTYNINFIQKKDYRLIKNNNVSYYELICLQYNNFIIGMYLMTNKVQSNKSFYKKNQTNSFFLQQSRTRSLNKNINFSISELLSATSTQISPNQQQLQNQSKLNLSPIFQKPNFNQKFMILRRRKHYIYEKNGNSVQKNKRQQQIKQKIKERIKFQLSQINSSIVVNKVNKEDTKNNTIRISSSKILHHRSKNENNHRQQTQPKVQIRGETLPFRITQNSSFKGKSQSTSFIKKMNSFNNINTKCKTTSKTESIRKLQNSTMLSFQKSVQVKRGPKSSLGIRTQTKILKSKKSDDYTDIQPWDAAQRLPSIEF